MDKDGLRRRQFLRTSGVIVTTLGTGGSMIFGPDHAWAMATSNLDPHTARTLLVMTHDLFPHDRLGVQYYAVAVEAFDKQAATDPTVRRLLVEGVGRLDAAHGMPWIDLSDGAREAVLRSIEKTDFFTAVRTKSISSLYGNPQVYQMFGYGGPSAPLGGYLERGFDDIGWLPNT